MTQRPEFRTRKLKLHADYITESFVFPSVGLRIDITVKMYFCLLFYLGAKPDD